MLVEWTLDNKQPYVARLMSLYRALGAAAKPLERNGQRSKASSFLQAVTAKRIGVA